ncbi:hypothetical protein R1flu_012510 [Riccia fluitans]|uniref:HMA domain-containing protein n=1 Tax=Riccia fluitans TaxID=41844 RepID=A0ABD1ZAT5_9MARC
MSYMELFYGNQPSRMDTVNSRSGTYYPTPSRPVGWKTTSLVFNVPLCCESCVQKIRKALSKDEEVENVDVDMMKSKVIVTGYLNPERVLRKLRKVKKSAAFWVDSTSYDNLSGTQDPYSHTADYDYTDPNAFNENSHSYDYDYSSSRLLPNDYEYSSQTGYYDVGYNRDRAPSKYYNRSKSYRSSYEAYRYL